MNTFAVELFDDHGSQCTFYTVRKEGCETSETDKFFIKFENSKKHKRSLQELAKFLEIVIAEEDGAIEDYFRFENEAHALPPSGKHRLGQISVDFGNFPLRLYCLRLTENLVILFNGNEKTSGTAQSGNTSMAFYEANAFALKIRRALNDSIFIQADNRTLLNENGETDIII